MIQKCSGKDILSVEIAFLIKDDGDCTHLIVLQVLRQVEYVSVGVVLQAGMLLQEVSQLSNFVHLRVQFLTCSAATVTEIGRAHV